MIITSHSLVKIFCKAASFSTKFALHLGGSYVRFKFLSSEDNITKMVHFALFQTLMVSSILPLAEDSRAIDLMGDIYE